MIRAKFSALIDDLGAFAGQVKALASYLGHADPGFTLRVYTHLMPASEERTRQAIDRVFEPAAVGRGSRRRILVAD
jgi:integrase